MKTKKLLPLLLLGLTLTLYAQKIPITTSSKTAVEFYKKGWELEDKLELDEAEKMFREAVNLDSTFALAYLRLGMVKDNYDNRKKQLKLALKYIDDISEAEKLWIKGRAAFYIPEEDESKEYGYFKQLVELYPNDEMANYLFAFVNLHHGVLKPDLAIHHFEKAITLSSNFIKPYNELIYTYLENRDFTNAKRIAKKYIRLLPNSVNPLDTYAEIFMRNGEYKKSIEAYKDVLKIDSQFPWALLGISANMNFLDKHNEGRIYIEKLDEERLSDYEYRHKWRAKVSSYLDEGNIKKAIEVLEQQKQESITGRNKREPSFHIYFSYLRKTRLFYENNQPQLGFSEYQNWFKYVNESNRSEKAKARIKTLEKYYLAYGAFLNNNISLALNYLDAFKVINKTETENSKILLSRIYIEKELLDKAIEKIKETDLNNPYNQYWLMIAYKKVGDLNNAKKYRNKILNLNDRNNIDLSLVRRKTLDLKL